MSFLIGSSVKIINNEGLKLYINNEEVSNTDSFFVKKNVFGIIEEYDAENDTYKISNLEKHQKNDVFELSNTKINKKFHILSSANCIEANETIRFKVPYFMILVSLLQSGIFTYFIVQRNKENKLTTYPACPNELFYSVFTEECKDNRKNIYMMFSYQLCHAGIAHLAGNVFLQLIFGTPIELMFGSLKTFILYNSGVVGGSIFCFLFNPYTRVLGASAGVYSLFGIHVAHLILNWDDIKDSYVKRWERIFILSGFLCIEIMASTFNDSNTSHVAHLGGSVVGIFSGIIILDNFQQLYWERVLIITTKCLSAFIFGAFSFYYSFIPLNYSRC